MRLSLIALAGLCVAGPVASAGRPSAQARFDRLIAGMTAGEPMTCLPRAREIGYRTVGDRLVFRQGSRLVYVNQTQGGGCNPASNQALVIRAGLSRLCEGDMAHVTDPRTGMQFGSCTLGKFVPWRK
jgi:hypothetical protein